MKISKQFTTVAVLLAGPVLLFAQEGSKCKEVPAFAALRAALRTVVVQPGEPNGGLDNNMIQDITEDAHGHPKSAGGFGHPTCINNPSPAALQAACPVGPADPVAGCAPAAVH